MHSGSSVTTNSPAFSVSIGIAALVLEGRPLFDDEYAIADHVSIGHNDSSFSSSASSSLSTTPSSAGPSKAARYKSSHHQTPVSHQQDATQHLQRLRQKLHQLRSTPSTSRDCVEQLLANESNLPNNALCDSDDELEHVFDQQQSSSSSAKPINKTTLPMKPPALNSLQILAASSIQTTPRSFYQHNGILKTVESYFNDKLSTPSTSGCSSSSSTMSTPITSDFRPVLSNFRINQLKIDAKVGGDADKGQQKILGPHCDLFLKKIGLLKGASEQNPEFDEHFCDNSMECVSFFFYPLSIDIRLLHIPCSYFSVFAGRYITDS